MILQVRDIKKSFGGIKALDGVTFDIEENTIVGLIGTNGSGKTTLINVISGFMVPDSGHVRFDCRDISSSKPHEIARLGLCRTFQLARIFRRMTVLECMLLASTAQDEGLFNLFFKGANIYEQERKDIEKARRILELLDMGHLSNEYSSALSVGQQKLLSIGMVQMAGPRLVLLDEPVTGVNPALANRIFERIQLEKEEEKTTFLVVEHNIDILMKFCEKIYVMNKGKIIASGAPGEIQCNETVIDVYLGG
ncbi:MAG TPA: ABC transporter ATP-binding protein [Candidatus Methylomirabilis sp.]|nr:ABC transporter ATP-binding protein [Candidatus Methylomirabilis sp.]